MACSLAAAQQTPQRLPLAEQTPQLVLTRMLETLANIATIGTALVGLTMLLLGHFKKSFLPH